jgi:hypothetical protein
MLVILRILFTVQPPVVASRGPDPCKPVINPLGDGDNVNIEKTECNFHSYLKEAKDKERQKFGWAQVGFGGQGVKRLVEHGIKHLLKLKRAREELLPSGS